MKGLRQRVLYENLKCINVRLPFTPHLQELHGNRDGCFPLLADPLATRRTAIIGMFVMRPSFEAWDPLSDLASTPAKLLGQIYEAKDWAYHVDGLVGGGFISNHNALDSYRLALQYGTVDAVLVSDKTFCAESIGNGYLYQAYHVCGWNVLRAVDGLEQMIAAQRVSWQQLGYVSKRRYPALIVVSRSSKGGETTDQGTLMPDLLNARWFSARHPDGSAMEVYILTSQVGKQRLLDRIHSRSDKDTQWKDATSNALLAFSPDNDPTQIDLTRLCEMLYRELDIRIAQHDGGGMLMSDFIVAGALSQLNLSLMRKQSLQQLIKQSYPRKHFGLSCLFRNNPHVILNGAQGGLPLLLKPVYVLDDVERDVLIATFGIGKI